MTSGTAWKPSQQDQCTIILPITQEESSKEKWQAAYGVFAEEARQVESDYAPSTVNTDGYAARETADGRRQQNQNNRT